MLATKVFFLVAGLAKFKKEKKENEAVEVIHKTEEPKLESQPVRNYLKYVFPGEQEIQLMIIATDFPKSRKMFS